MRISFVKIVAFVCLLAASSAALAHPGHGTSGFAAGLAHPFLGLDHLLAMVAVGLWAAQGGGRRVWLLPAAFMSMLALGAGLALQWQALPLLETGIAVSVLALGLFIALALRLPAPVAATVTALFGLVHGYAHGLELPDSATPLAYALGFLAATSVLHLGGIALGVATSQRRAALARVAGAAFAAAGAYLLVAF
jgi:urease accessory protein